MTERSIEEEARRTYKSKIEYYEQYKDEMKLPEPRIEVAADLTEEQTRAYRLADNLLASTDYDGDRVISETSELNSSFQEMLKFGYVGRKHYMGCGCRPNEKGLFVHGCGVWPI